MSTADSDNIETDIDFGSELAEARQSRNFTVEEISNYLKIPVHTINVIEANDLDGLPAPTFAQGYIRAYAKFLEISEEDVLGKYYRAVPQADTASLKPRSNLPGEASSQSPIVKSVTVLLIIAGISAVIFGSFKYYQEKAGVMEGEMDAKEQSFTGNSLDSPGSERVSSKRDARLTEDDQLAVGQSDPFEKISEAETGSEEVADDLVSSEISQQDGDLAVPADLAAPVEEERAEEASNNDIIEIIADNGSWVEVRDANDARLFYNMVPVSGSKVLEGKAPFSITMGNAKTTRVKINEFEADLTGYIRSNNTAKFSISTSEQGIIFH